MTDDPSMQAFVTAEIRRQPEAWTQAVAALPAVAGQLPQPGERVAVIGCGTSWFMAIAYAALREGRGLGETDAFPASEFPAGRRYDRVVAISRSGTTTEVVQALANTSAPSVAITALPSPSPVSAVAGHVVELPWADERSVVQTVFATTTLMLLRASLGEDTGPVIEQARAILADERTVPELAHQVSFLGQGWAYGIALEAGLKVREAAQLWTESYLQMEYRHGPIAIAEAERMVWLLGDPVEGLVADIDATGATFINSGLDPVADLVRAQLAAVRAAQRRGLDPDQPRHLTRSVILSTP